MIIKYEYDNKKETNIETNMIIKKRQTLKRRINKKETNIETKNK